VKKGKSPQKLLSRQELLEATGLSPKALKQYEESDYVAAAEVRDGVKYYSQETSELVQAMTRCLGRCANLQEAHHIALQGLAQKERRDREAEAAQLQFIDPTKIKLHPKFKGILSIGEDLEESLVTQMAVGGFYWSIPIVLATWPGQEEPVLIDGHTRLRAAIQAGVPKIPYVVEKFGYPFTYARQAVIARSQATKQSLILRSQIKEIASLRSQ
jgi:DNA-binding transcriptional MerR regulator